MVHTKCVEIGQLVSEKEIFERFLPYMGVGAILVIILSLYHEDNILSMSLSYVWSSKHKFNINNKKLFNNIT